MQVEELVLPKMTLSNLSIFNGLIAKKKYFEENVGSVRQYDDMLCYVVVCVFKWKKVFYSQKLVKRSAGIPKQDKRIKVLNVVMTVLDNCYVCEHKQLDWSSLRKPQQLAMLAIIKDGPAQLLTT